MTVSQFRAELLRELQAMKSSETGRKTWSAQDVALIMKGQTDSVLANVMKTSTPKEYAEMLSM